MEDKKIENQQEQEAKPEQELKELPEEVSTEDFYKAWKAGKLREAILKANPGLK